jgi:hypothetical protein
MITEGQIKRQADALRAEIASLQVRLDQEEEMGVARQREIAILRDERGRSEIELGECQATLAEIRRLYMVWVRADGCTDYWTTTVEAGSMTISNDAEAWNDAEAARDALIGALEKLVISEEEAP